MLESRYQAENDLLRRIVRLMNTATIAAYGTTTHRYFLLIIIIKSNNQMQSSLIPVTYLHTSKTILNFYLQSKKIPYHPQRLTKY